MRPIIFHITFFVALATIAVVGVIWNIQPVAVFLGTLVALCTDPLILMFSPMAGALSRSTWVLVAICVVASLLLSLYIARSNAHLGAQMTLFVTLTPVVAILSLALAANVLQHLVARRTA